MNRPALLVFLSLTAMCTAQADRVRIASLSDILSDVAAHVGGDHVEIANVIKPGVDPHHFEPTPADMKMIASSQLVLAYGLGFEHYWEGLRKAASKGPQFLALGDIMEPIYLSEHAHDHGHSHGHAHDDHGRIPDPHWWQSIRNMEKATTKIRDTLIQIDPSNADAYRENAANYVERLEALEKWVRLEVAKLPKANRVLVTSHDALGYFARDYGFTIYPIEGLSTREEASSKRIAELIEIIRRHKVRAIFGENLDQPKVLAEIEKATGAKLAGNLYVDSLDSGVNSYEAMVRHNVTTIVNALQ